MSMLHRPLRPVTSSPIPTARVPRWGYLSRTVSHYGTVACVLAIYPPDSTDAERRLAEVHRWYAPLSFGGGVVVWVMLCASGFPPLLAAVALITILLPVGVALARRSRSLRQRTVTLSSCRSGLAEGTQEERVQQRRLDTLAEAMEDAALACRQRVTGSSEGFDRVWRAAYAHASTIAASSARAAR